MMKKLVRIVAAACCLFGLTFPLERKADASATGTIIGTEVRMRKGAGTNTEIIGYFDDGEKVEVLKSNVNEGRKWYEVNRQDGTQGWVVSEYCRVPEGSLIPSETRLQDRKGKIIGTEVRMRSDPNQNADVLDYFEKGRSGHHSGCCRWRWTALDPGGTGKRGHRLGGFGLPAGNLIDWSNTGSYDTIYRTTTRRL